MMWWSEVQVLHSMDFCHLQKFSDHNPGMSEGVGCYKGRSLWTVSTGVSLITCKGDGDRLQQGTLI